MDARLADIQHRLERAMQVHVLTGPNARTLPSTALDRHECEEVEPLPMWGPAHPFVRYRQEGNVDLDQLYLELEPRSQPGDWTSSPPGSGGTR